MDDIVGQPLFPEALATVLTEVDVTKKLPDLRVSSLNRKIVAQALRLVLRDLESNDEGLVKSAIVELKTFITNLVLSMGSSELCVDLEQLDTFTINSALKGYIEILENTTSKDKLLVVCKTKDDILVGLEHNFDENLTQIHKLDLKKTNMLAEIILEKKLISQKIEDLAKSRNTIVCWSIVNLLCELGE